MPTATTSKYGLFTPPSNPILVAHYSIDMDNAWEERVDGNAFYLVRASGGNAIDAVQKGIGTAQMGITNSVDLLSGIQENSGTPAIKWILNVDDRVFYKVIRVVNDNLIQVESIHSAGAGFTLEAIGTRGYNPSSLTLYVVTTAPLTVYRYNPDGVVADNSTVITASTVSQTITIPVNIQEEGPILINGDSSFSVNV